jgi:hypothetical protein
LRYNPQFLDESYLSDRLSDLKVGTVTRELENHPGRHTINRPTLAMKQTLYRAKANACDRFLASAIFTNTYWLVLIPIGMIALLGVYLRVRDRQPALGLSLYFVAGSISLVVELLILYLYQCIVGTLHAQLAALIGVFMLGLATGTFWASRLRMAVVERLSLILMLMAIVALLVWQAVWPIFFTAYAFTLMLVTAVATGGLFVAATRRYYAARPRANRGAGYAMEISGSAVGALLTTTVLLPTIGLDWILVSCLILIGLALLASLVTRPAV